MKWYMSLLQNGYFHFQNGTFSIRLDNFLLHVCTFHSLNLIQIQLVHLHNYGKYLSMYIIAGADPKGGGGYWGYNPTKTLSDTYFSSSFYWCIIEVCMIILVRFLVIEI